MKRFPVFAVLLGLSLCLPSLAYANQASGTKAAEKKTADDAKQPAGGEKPSGRKLSDSGKGRNVRDRLNRHKVGGRTNWKVNDPVSAQQLEQLKQIEATKRPGAGGVPRGEPTAGPKMIGTTPITDPSKVNVQYQRRIPEGTAGKRQLPRWRKNIQVKLLKRTKPFHEKKLRLLVLIMTKNFAKRLNRRKPKPIAD